jgi:type I restriction enzyme S subunit
MAKLLYDYWFVQYDFPLSTAQAAALGKPRLAGKPYRSSGGPMVYHEQLKREIPKGWSAGSLDCLGEIVGGSTPSTKEDHFFSPQGTPWITPKDLSRNTGNKFITRGETGVTDAGIKGASLTLLVSGQQNPTIQRRPGVLRMTHHVIHHRIHPDQHHQVRPHRPHPLHPAI